MSTASDGELTGILRKQGDDFGNICRGFGSDYASGMETILDGKVGCN